MVKIQLRMKANLENLDWVILDENDGIFAFKVSKKATQSISVSKESPLSIGSFLLQIRCGHCREMHPTWVEVGKSRLYQYPDHKGSFHLIAKCKNCLRENSLGAYD